LIVFDYDGTICDTRRAISFSLKATFDYFNAVPPVESKRTSLISKGISLEETLRLLNPELEQSALSEWIRIYREIYRTEGEAYSTAFEGAGEILGDLYRQCVKLVVISNKGIGAIEGSLQKLDLTQYTSLILADGVKTTAVLKMKPDPMIYNELVRPQFPDVQSARTLMVGDTAADIRFAQNSGIRSCWAAYGYGARESCVKLGPDYIISRIRDLRDIVLK